MKWKSKSSAKNGRPKGPLKIGKRVLCHRNEREEEGTKLIGVQAIYEVHEELEAKVGRREWGILNMTNVYMQKK